MKPFFQDRYLNKKGKRMSGTNLTLIANPKKMEETRYFLFIKKDNARMRKVIVIASKCRFPTVSIITSGFKIYNKERLLFTDIDFRKLGSIKIVVTSARKIIDFNASTWK